MSDISNVWIREFLCGGSPSGRRDPLCKDGFLYVIRSIFLPQDILCQYILHLPAYLRCEAFRSPRHFSVGLYNTYESAHAER